MIDEQQSVVRTYRFSELYKHPRHPQPYIISDGLLKKHSLMVIGGPPKAYKSFTLNTIAMCLVTGKPVFNTFRSPHGRTEYAFTVPRPHKVLICEQEIGEDDLEDRLVPIYSAMSDDDKRLVEANLFTHSFDDELAFDTQAGMLKLEEVVKETGAEVVIFDPLIEFHSQEENSNTAMGLVLKNFMRLCRRCKITPIISHHEGHGGNSQGREKEGAEKLRGATVVFGKGDCFLSLKVVNRNAGRIQIDFTLRRGKPIKSILCRIDPDTLFTTFMCWQGDKKWKDALKEAIISDIEDSPHEVQ